MTSELDEKINTLVESYYTEYYRDQLGLQDWQKRIKSRKNEEQVFGELNIRRVENWIDYDFKGKKVLIVGAGTGAELFKLHERGANVYGLEPSEEAVEILHLKAERSGLSWDHIVLALRRQTGWRLSR